MRIQPDGVELLRAALLAVDTTIRPHLPDARQAALCDVERVMSFAQRRLAHDTAASAAELAVLEDAQATMRGELLESLPSERRYDARLVAKAICIAAQRLANGSTTDRREYELLSALLGSPGAPDAGAHAVRAALPGLNRQLVARIRAGALDANQASERAALPYLAALTEAALTESNPSYRRRNRSSISAPPPYRLPIGLAPAKTSAGASITQIALSPPRIRARAIGETMTSSTQSDGLLHAIGEALYRPAGAALAAQADFLGWFTQRLAANPCVPMAAVESAHQVHDLAVGFAEASTAFFKVALAPLRYLESRTASTTW